MRVYIFAATIIVALNLISCSANIQENPESLISHTSISESSQNLINSDKKKQYLSAEPVELTLPDDGKIYVGYTLNSESAGYIDGKKIHCVSDNPVRAVEAIPNLGYKFVMWSDGITERLRLNDTFSENTVITAIFDYDILDMPILSIVTETGREIESKTDYINSTFTILGTDDKYELHEISTEIRGRGNNSWGYPKKSYKFKLSEKMNLFGMAEGKEKIWVLLANQCDQSLLRNQTSYNLAKNLSGIDFAPASKSVDLYLNGEYRGVYLLAEEIKVSNNRIKIDEDVEKVDTGFLIELSNYANGDVFRVNGRTYQITSDLSTDLDMASQQIDFIKSYVSKCMKAVLSGEREEIELLLDLDSLIDAYIVEEVIKNIDSGWDSFYLHKDSGGKLILGPMWDFDLALGNANEGFEFYTDLYVASGRGSGGGNPWFSPLMREKWFRALVLERWESIIDEINKVADDVLKNGEEQYRSFVRNFKKWKIFGIPQNRETEFITSLSSYEEHYKYLAQWITNRINWMDEYYHSDDYINGKFTTPKKPSSSPVNGDKNSQEIMGKYKSLNEYINENSINAPSGFPGEEINNAFDGNPESKYCLESFGETVITFNTKKEIIIEAFAIMTGSDTAEYPMRNPDSIKIYGSNDEGTDWTIIYDKSDIASAMGTENLTYYAFTVQNPVSYKYYKILIEDSETIQFSEFLILGNK